MFSKSLVISLFFLSLTSSINAIPVPRNVESDAVCIPSIVLLIDLILTHFSASRRPLSLLRWYHLCFVQLCVQYHNDLITPAGDLLGLVDDGLNLGQELGLLPSSQSSTKRQGKSCSCFAFRCDDSVTPDVAGVCTASSVLLIDFILICSTGPQYSQSRLQQYRLFLYPVLRADNDMITPANDIIGVINSGVTLGETIGSLLNNTKRQGKRCSGLRTAS